MLIIPGDSVAEVHSQALQTTPGSTWNLLFQSFKIQHIQHYNQCVAHTQRWKQLFTTQSSLI